MEGEEARDYGGARPGTVQSRNVPTRWWENKRKGHQTVGCLENATIPAPSLPIVVGPGSPRGESARDLLLPVAIHCLACQAAGPPDLKSQDADLPPTESKKVPRIPCEPTLPAPLLPQQCGILQHVAETSLAKSDPPPLDDSLGSCGDCPPSWPNTRR